MPASKSSLGNEFPAGIEVLIQICCGVITSLDLFHFRVFLRASAPLREYGFEDAMLFRVGHSNVRVGSSSYSEAKRVYAAASLGRLPTPNSEEPCYFMEFQF